MPSGSDALHLIRVRRRLFGTPAQLPPAHRAALGVFITDLVRPYGLALREQEVHNGHSYGEMAAELIAETVGAHEPVDLLVLAFAIPDLWPGRATATYLSHVCPGEPLAFAVCDQGTAAAFTGLRLAREYLRGDGFERALVLIVEQAVLPYEPAAPVTLPQRHAGVALLCGRSGGLRLEALEQHPDVTAERAIEMLGDTRDTGTGAWWELDPSSPGGEVLVADYDPLLRYLCLARFTSADVAGI
ncbi:2-hydroxy-acid oxidase [Allorhizocola rhizosphaerae]|uniref:2-hydroxy-acid oxidase n=1 Tax=Allorhizocola rhizosphaerae TaxID=1872709 RepID=UPI000E3D254A|nr:2-hydroxy-acid oxidase [Allorhizocola rhizosphaerae]